MRQITLEVIGEGREGGRGTIYSINKVYNISLLFYKFVFFFTFDVSCWELVGKKQIGYSNLNSLTFQKRLFTKHFRTGIDKKKYINVFS